jgi:hypothetical protein
MHRRNSSSSFALGSLNRLCLGTTKPEVSVRPNNRIGNTKHELASATPVNLIRKVPTSRIGETTGGSSFFPKRRESNPPLPLKLKFGAESCLRGCRQHGSVLGMCCGG